MLVKLYPGGQLQNLGGVIFTDVLFIAPGKRALINFPCDTNIYVIYNGKLLKEAQRRNQFIPVAVQSGTAPVCVLSAFLAVV